MKFIASSMLTISMDFSSAEEKAFQPVFDDFCQRGPVSLNARRTETFQHVKNIF